MRHRVDDRTTFRPTIGSAERLPQTSYRRWIWLATFRSIVVSSAVRPQANGDPLILAKSLRRWSVPVIDGIQSYPLSITTDSGGADQFLILPRWMRIRHHRDQHIGRLVGFGRSEGHTRSKCRTSSPATGETAPASCKRWQFRGDASMHMSAEGLLFISSATRSTSVTARLVRYQPKSSSKSCSDSSWVRSAERMPNSGRWRYSMPTSSLSRLRVDLWNPYFLATGFWRTSISRAIPSSRSRFRNPSTWNPS